MTEPSGLWVVLVVLAGLAGSADFYFMLFGYAPDASTWAGLFLPLVLKGLCIGFLVLAIHEDTLLNPESPEAST